MMRVEPGNWRLVAVLVALLSGLLVTRAGRAGSASAEPLFPGFAPESVQRLLVERGTGAGAERVELVRRAGGWILTSAFGHAAHAFAVEELLGRVAYLRRERVSRDAGAHALYGVGADGVRVLVEGDAGRVLAAFVQGVAPPGPAADGALGSYVRLPEGSEVFRAPLFPQVEPVLERWIDARLLPLDPAEVRELRLRDETGAERVLARGAEGAWAAPGSAVELPGALVERLLSAASGAYFTALVGSRRAGELAERGRAFEVRGAGVASVWLAGAAADGARYALRFDAQDPQATSPLGGGPAGDAAGWLVTLPAATAERLEQRFDDLWSAAQEAAR